MDSLSTISKIIQEKDNFYILGHIDPDGDCIGSMVVLREIVKKYNKKYNLVFYNKPDSKYDFILEDDYILYSDINNKNIDWEQINIIALDSGDFERIGKIGETKKEILINIDHHHNNPLYGEYNYLDSEAAAVGEILYRLVKEMNVEITLKISKAIAVAIIQDTGYFRYQNTSAKILRLIADFMEKGINLYQINKKLYSNHSLAKMKLKGLALSTLQRDFKAKVAWLYVDQDMLSETGSDISDISGFVNYARDIKNVEVGICFSAINNKQTKVSLRSKDYIPVDKIAEKFSGGGHPRAAGFIVGKKLTETIKLVIHEVNNFV